MMRDPITDAAQDPSCILAVTPDRGGSWWSRLRPPTLWPSSVPRDFAEESKTWYDFQDMQLAADWTHDYTFECTFMLHTRDAPAPVLYEYAARHMFGVYQYKDNTIGLFTTLCKQTASANNYLGYIITAENATIFWESYHTVKIVVNGTSTSFYIDNELIRTFSSNYERTPKADLDLTTPFTKTGYIDNCFIQDDTTGRTVWSYPSEAERTRLLTNTNVRTDRGVFESPSSGVYRRIKTRLDLRGNSKSLTLVSRAFIPSHSADGKLYASGLITQGMFTSGPASQVAAMSVWEDHRQTPSTLRLYTTASTSSNTEQGTSGVIPTTALDRWTTFAGVYDFELGTVTCYVDGVAVRAVNRGTLTAFGQGANSDLSDAVSILHDLSNPILGMCDHKISWAMVFDRAFTAAEIAALMPKKQLLSWAGIQDVVRRGRAQRYFAVGDVLTVATPRWTIEYEVVGFDQVEPADSALTHSMTLLPVRLVTSLQFDAPEPGNPDANREQYGCNRWDWSSIRQWMNSAAAPGEWWTAQHEYDAAPDYAATMAGFMADLPADFLSAVAPARLVTALPNMDGGGSVETVDRFWLPSRTEIFGALDGEMSEGVQMTKYVDATDTDRIKYNVTGTALSWWLRTHSFGTVVRVQAVSDSGTSGFNSAVSAYGVVPCCIIA